MKEKAKKYAIYLVPLTVFFILFRIVPMMYDGWASKFYYNNSGGLLGWISQVKLMYFWYNGRISSNFISGILESFSSEIPLDFINAFVLTSLIYYSNKLFETKKITRSVLIFTALLLLVSKSIRNEVLFYANTAYVPVVLFIILFLYYIKQYQNPKIEEKSKRQYIYYIYFLVFLISTWMEHIALGFGILLTLRMIYESVKMKRINTILLNSFLISLISGLFMMMAPGLRRSRTLISSSVNIFNQFTKNTYYVAQEVFTNNYFLMITLFIVIILIFITRKEIKIWIRTLVVLGASMYTGVFILYLVGKFLNQDFGVKFLNFRYSTLPYYVNLSIIGGMVLVILIGVYFSKHRMNLLFLLGIGITSLVTICATPNISARVSSIGLFVLLLILIGLLNDIDYNFQFVRFLTLFITLSLFVIGLDQTILLGRRVYQVQTLRTKIINEVVLRQSLGEWNYEDTVYLPIFKEGDILNRGNTTIGTFHYPQFLEASGLDLNTKVIGTNSKFIIETTINSKYLMNVKIINPFNKSYVYSYRIQVGEDVTSEFQDIFNSGEIKTDEFNIQVGPRFGYYNILIYYQEVESTIQPKLIDQPVNVLIKYGE